MGTTLLMPRTVIVSLVIDESGCTPVNSVNENDSGDVSSRSTLLVKSAFVGS